MSIEERLHLEPKHEFPINDNLLFNFFFEHLKPLDSTKEPHQCIVPLFEGEIKEEQVKLSKETEKFLFEASELAFFNEEHIVNDNLKPIMYQINKKIGDKKGEKFEASEGIKPLCLALNEIFAILCEISYNNSPRKKPTTTNPEKPITDGISKTPTSSEKITEDKQGNTTLRHKLKIKLLEAIWPRFIRRSIQTLRSCDSRDRGTY